MSCISAEEASASHRRLSLVVELCVPREISTRSSHRKRAKYKVRLQPRLVMLICCQDFLNSNLGPGMRCPFWTRVPLLGPSPDRILYVCRNHSKSVMTTCENLLIKFLRNGLAASLHFPPGHFFRSYCITAFSCNVRAIFLGLCFRAGVCT